jgi:ATP-dependent helicase HrpA
MERRMEKLPERLQQDTRHASTVHTFRERLRARVDALNKAHRPTPATLDAFRWEIEELRISLFAQELGTPRPVSAKRLEKLWAAIHG